MFTITPVASESELEVLRGQVSTYGDFSYRYDAGTIALLQRNLRRENSLYLIAFVADEFARFISCDTDW